MAMKHFEDMNAIELEAMVETLLEMDPKLAEELTPKHTPAECKNWDDVVSVLGQHNGFRRGELNILTSGRSS